jgi:hypothetical protein
MGLTTEHVGPKILAKTKIYVLTRAELLFNLCYEIPCIIEPGLKPKRLHLFDNFFYNFWTHLSRSAHRTHNFMNPKFQFPQFVVLQSVFSNEFYWHFRVYFYINLKLLSRKNTQKVNKPNIRDS